LMDVDPSAGRFGNRSCSPGMVDVLGGL